MRFFILLTFALHVLSASQVRSEDQPKLTEENLFAAGRLGKVEITIARPDWDYLRSQTRSMAAALSKGELSKSPYRYFKADVAIDGVKFESVGIRKKGFLGSQDDIRPSLKIKLNEYQDNGRIGNLDRLTLNNNKQDATVAYQFLGYRLYREAGLPAPRCGLAEVFVNGESLGVYSNVESVKKPFLKNEFGDDSGDLYEGTYPTDFYPDRIIRFEVKTNDDDADRAELMAIAKLLEEPGDDLVEQLARHVDMEQFHRFWAMESIIGFWDGYCANQNNFFVYVNPKDSRLHFMPWGLDSAFSESILTPFNPGPASVKARGRLPFLLYQDEKARKRHVETVRELLDSVWNEKELVEKIDRVTKMTEGHRHEAQGDAKKATDRMKAFVSLRRRRILAEIKNGPVKYTTPPPPPTYSRKVGEISGKFSTVWADKPDEDRLGTGTASLTLKIGDKDVKFTQVGAVAEPQPPSPFAPPRPGPAPPTLTFTAKRESNGRSISLWIGFFDAQFKGSKDKLQVQGLMMDGRNIFTMRFFAGTAVLKEAERKEGSAVAGTISGSLFQLKRP